MFDYGYGGLQRADRILVQEAGVHDRALKEKVIDQMAAMF